MAFSLHRHRLSCKAGHPVTKVVHYEDEIVQVPVQKQVHVPVVTKVPKTVPVEQVEYVDHHAALSQKKLDPQMDFGFPFGVPLTPNKQGAPATKTPMFHCQRLTCLSRFHLPQPFFVLREGCL